jgi:hypothetical protein
VPDELGDVDAAIAENAALPVWLGDLGLDGNDALEARLEVIGHARWNLPEAASATRG